MIHPPGSDDPCFIILWRRSFITQIFHRKNYEVSSSAFSSSVEDWVNEDVNEKAFVSLFSFVETLWIWLNLFHSFLLLKCLNMIEFVSFFSLFQTIWNESICFNVLFNWNCLKWKHFFHSFLWLTVFKWTYFFHCFLCFKVFEYDWNCFILFDGWKCLKSKHLSGCFHLFKVYDNSASLE